MASRVIDNVRLDLSKPQIKTSISVRKGDTATREIHITLIANGSVYSLEDAVIALILIEKPDGTHCYNDCVISGNEIQHTLSSQSINVLGECKCQIEVTFNEGETITSPDFSIMVYNQKVDRTEVISQNEYRGIAVQVAYAKQYAQEANTSAANASVSATEAKTAEENVKISESNSKLSEEAAKLSEENVEKSLDEIKQYSEVATKAAQDAENSSKEAAESSDSALLSAGNAKVSENKVTELEQTASEYVGEIREYYEAIKDTGVLTLGINHTNAFYGDLGQEAYNHSQKSGNPHGTTYAQVGADKEGQAQAAYENSVAYTDQAIAGLINGAPTTLDTLKEIADAMAENESVVEALEAAVGNKANKVELDTYVEILNELIDRTGYPYNPSTGSEV